MILQSLADYYRRLEKDPDSPVAPYGFQKKEIAFIIVLTSEGNLFDIIDTREGVGRNKIAKTFLVPREVKRAANITPNLLWDNAGYALGISSTEKDNVKRVKEAHESFLKRIHSLLKDASYDPGVAAVLTFLQSDRKGLRDHPLWPELASSVGYISFKLLEDDSLICHRKAVLAAVSSAAPEVPILGFCLLSGMERHIVRLHNKVVGVWGCQQNRGDIVSFNLPAFCSQHKTQSFNAPVSVEEEFAYITALNTLLAKGSRKRLQVGDASTVFWAERPNPMENLFGDFFGLPEDESAAEKVDQTIKDLYSAPSDGTLPLVEDLTRFFVLGLAPNAARIAIRFWHQGTVGQVAARIIQHFEDAAISHHPAERDYLPLFRLLISTAALGKSDNIPPSLGGELMGAILDGTPYPLTLLTAALRRVRAEKEITYARAALIKAVLVRQARYYHSQAKEVTVSLDPSNQNPGYLLGRLFAALERIQERANPGLNTTIRDRFYGAASATPVAAFSQLMKLKNHHLSKMENRGEAVNLEKLVSEIVNGLVDFPGQLSLMDQGRFAIGYYHQRQALFTRKDKPSGEESN